MGFFDTYTPNKDNALKSMELLPSGRYQLKLIATKQDTYAAASGPAESLNLTFEVSDGPHKGRKLYKSVTLVHPNAKKMEFGSKELDTLVAISGAKKLPNDFIGKMFNFRVVQQPKWNDATKILNEVMIEMPSEGASAPIPTPAGGGLFG